MDSLDLLDPAARLRLAPGLCVVQRSESILQIGSEAPRCALVRNAPRNAAKVLASLDGMSSIAELINRLGPCPDFDDAGWQVLLSDLVDAGYLLVAGKSERPSHRPDTATVAPEHEQLALLAGPSRASLAMRNRREAVIQILGAGRIAASVASLLANAGVGRIHLNPDRPLRPTDVCAAGVGHPPTPAHATRTKRTAVDLAAGSEVRTETGEATGADHVDRAGLLGPSTSRQAPLRDPRNPVRPDRVTSPRIEPVASARVSLAEVVHRVAPLVATHAPSGYVPATLVVIAGDGPPDPARVSDLMERGIPHLAIRAGSLRGVVGPLVLPRRTACLTCTDLHRTAMDPGWPLVSLALTHSHAVPTAVMTAAVAAASADQILHFLDGIATPETVGGTLEFQAQQWQPRRRSWDLHPDCRCQSPAVRPTVQPPKISQKKPLG
ncbi:hypothetical protein EH165_09880 [Nakamurella antarctica]|uniref:ThiF family protein n=1 Tax=Nakamurella antarctica TaxID=1902245 RepID=A0A3G8ZMD1_9ACTN|nr:hypothetical protein [Nakamurella antarctica]AZI58400.1 hypothetical protein EH165_09880 [Nakamurella antarctica]